MIAAVSQYRDRTEAGHVLARHLAHYASRVDALVLALPPGGVPVAVEVAGYLNAPLDTLAVRKLAPPDHPELALGALAGGVQVLDDDLVTQSGLPRHEFDSWLEHEAAALQRLEHTLRGNRPPPQIRGRVIILIDDGLATGLSMHAAAIAVHRHQPAWIVVAAPVGAPEACDELAQEVHEVVCPLRPDPFQAVGLAYEHFAPTEIEDARDALRRASGLQRP